ncbi:MAG TPA: hemerythrin family protein [Clostridiales bacterium]|nr:hemerythrin family protein [Clostridiales bacterium]
MAKFEMKPEFFTGIDFIDQEHAKLFSLANEAYELLTNDFIPDKYDYILELVNELRDYTKYHFTHEEEYMQQIGYRRILSQKVDHMEFVAKLDEYDLTTIDENQKEVLMNLLVYLNEWLIGHIYKKDKLIAEE